MAKSLEFLGSEQIEYYVVTRYSMQTTTDDLGRPSLNIEIQLGRELLTIILTTIIPTVLLCIISFSTNFMKNFFFEAVVTVNLTVMLVLTTLFVSVRHTHYITLHIT